MRVSILFQITGDDGVAVAAEEIAAFEKVTTRPEDVGLSLADGKALLAAVQGRIVQAQAWRRTSSLVPYAAAAGLLADVLPVASGANATTLRQHALRVVERAEAELGKEQMSFVEGCPAQWAELPNPEGRIVVGLDGGTSGLGREEGQLRVDCRRSIPEDRAPRYIGLVHGYDRKPKRRLFDLLQQQGLRPTRTSRF